MLEIVLPLNQDYRCTNDLLLRASLGLFVVGGTVLFACRTALRSVAARRD